MFDGELELATPTKCVFMRIRVINPQHLYVLRGTSLIIVNNFKYICIHFCDDQSFNLHFNVVCYLLEYYPVTRKS